jgi:hypothetical protein
MAHGRRRVNAPSENAETVRRFAVLRPQCLTTTGTKDVARTMPRPQAHGSLLMCVPGTA